VNSDHNECADTGAAGPCECVACECRDATARAEEAESYIALLEELVEEVIVFRCGGGDIPQLLEAVDEFIHKTGRERP
jgi:hypothetical protein